MKTDFFARPRRHLMGAVLLAALAALPCHAAGKKAGGVNLSTFIDDVRRGIALSEQGAALDDHASFHVSWLAGAWQTYLSMARHDRKRPVDPVSPNLRVNEAALDVDLIAVAKVLVADSAQYPHLAEAAVPIFVHGFILRQYGAGDAARKRGAQLTGDAAADLDRLCQAAEPGTYPIFTAWLARCAAARRSTAAWEKLSEIDRSHYTQCMEKRERQAARDKAYAAAGKDSALAKDPPFTALPDLNAEMQAFVANICGMTEAEVLRVECSPDDARRLGRGERHVVRRLVVTLVDKGLQVKGSFADFRDQFTKDYAYLTEIDDGSSAITEAARKIKPREPCRIGPMLKGADYVGHCVLKIVPLPAPPGVQVSGKQVKASLIFHSKGRTRVVMAVTQYSSPEDVRWAQTTLQSILLNHARNGGG